MIKEIAGKETEEKQSHDIFEMVGDKKNTTKMNLKQQENYQLLLDNGLS